MNFTSNYEVDYSIVHYQKSPPKPCMWQEDFLSYLLLGRKGLRLFIR